MSKIPGKKFFRALWSMFKIELDISRISNFGPSESEETVLFLKVETLTALRILKEPHAIVNLKSGTLRKSLNVHKLQGNTFEVDSKESSSQIEKKIEV